MPGRRNVKTVQDQLPPSDMFGGKDPLMQNILRQDSDDKPTELDLLRVEVVLLKRQINLLKEYADYCIPFGKTHFDRWLVEHKGGARWQE